MNKKGERFLQGWGHGSSLHLSNPSLEDSILSNGWSANLLPSSVNIISHKWTVDGIKQENVEVMCSRKARTWSEGIHGQDVCFVSWAESPSHYTAWSYARLILYWMVWQSLLATHASPSSLATEHRFGSCTWYLCVLEEDGPFFSPRGELWFILASHGIYLPFVTG